MSYHYSTPACVQRLPEFKSLTCVAKIICGKVKDPQVLLEDLQVTSPSQKYYLRVTSSLFDSEIIA
jgi:hypothetical protein